jgi:hypothetical protein
MYLNPPTHDQSLRSECLPRKKSSPSPFFNHSEYNLGQVSSDSRDREREWRDTPPLDRLSAADGTRTKARLSHPRKTMRFLSRTVVVFRCEDNSGSNA